MSLKTFISGISDNGGVSLSNNYDVDFNFSNSDIQSWFNKFNIDLSNTGTTSGSGTGPMIQMLCDEAQLPNVQAATGQVTGKFLGEGQVNYAHTKIYSDFQLGWMCDANMTPLKFLNAWYSYIFRDYDYTSGDGSTIDPSIESGQSLSDLKNSVSNLTRERSVRLNWPSEYQATVTITKTERGKNAPNERASIMYTLLNVFPYSIDAVPLSYGASQITKVTANFYYSKHIVSYNKLSTK